MSIVGVYAMDHLQKSSHACRYGKSTGRVIYLFDFHTAIEVSLQLLAEECFMKKKICRVSVSALVRALPRAPECPALDPASLRIDTMPIRGLRCSSWGIKRP